MKLIANGIVTHGTPGTSRSVIIFPALLPLSHGVLLAAGRSGSKKDSDDETIEFYRSYDGGQSWQGPHRPFGEAVINGKRGGLKLCYLTEVGTGHLMAASMWVDHESFPGQPLFNPETEGALPMEILLADSYDQGESWSPWRVVPMPAEVGPPSLTSPLLKLGDGTLAMSIETNKVYADSSRWFQRVVLFHSKDGGHTWSGPVVAGEDTSGRIFNWDQRAGVAPDGRIGTFIWTYDSESHRYVNIHRRISQDAGQTWSEAEDLGITDQAGHPAILPDGRTVLPWVDRFNSHSIRARLAPDIGGAFDPASEVVIYTHGGQQEVSEETKDLLVGMSLWTFGLPYAEALPDGDVLVLYYAGNETTMDMCWARLRLEN